MEIRGRKHSTRKFEVEHVQVKDYVTVQEKSRNVRQPELTLQFCDELAMGLHFCALSTNNPHSTTLPQCALRSKEEATMTMQAGLC